MSLLLQSSRQSNFTARRTVRYERYKEARSARDNTSWKNWRLTCKAWKENGLPNR